MPSIAMSYRNDAEVRDGGHSRYGLGDTEWFDVDVAIDYARAHGARQVVVFGWSMGGAIAFQAASRGRNRGFIAGLVLDGPVVDWHDVLDNQARLNYLPTPIARLTLDMITRPWARSITGLETPIDLERLDWVTRAAELDKPVLLIHSDDDQFVPSGPSHALGPGPVRPGDDAGVRHRRPHEGVERRPGALGGRRRELPRVQTGPLRTAMGLTVRPWVLTVRPGAPSAG